LEYYYKWDVLIQHLRRNCLSDTLDEMAAIYHEWGLTYCRAVARLRAASYLGEWMQENGISPQKITPEDVARFSAQFVPPMRKTDPTPRSNCNSRAGVNMALKLLRKKYPPKPPLKSFVDKEMDAYTEFLRTKRALADGGVANHVFFVRPFLEAMFGDGPIRPACLAPESVRQYVLNQRQRYQLATIRSGVAGKLRSLFKHWELAGHEMKRASSKKSVGEVGYGKLCKVMV